MPRNTLRCPDNPLSLLPCSSFRMKNLAINSSQYRGSVHPNCSCVSQKFFEVLFDLTKILSSLLLWKFLSACIMVNSIWLVVFVDTPWLCHFEPNDSMCANARYHQVILLNYLSDSDVLPDMSWFLAIQFFIDCPTKSFSLSILGQSVCFWSFTMEFIIHLYFKHQTIQLFVVYHVSAFFLPLIDYRY
jgi:hypothetical protein